MLMVDPGIIPGTALSFCEGLIDDDERCIISDEDSESPKDAVSSRIPLYLDNAAVVRRIEASAEAALGRFSLTSFFASNKRMKSFKSSSSSFCALGIDPELPPVAPSASTSDPSRLVEEEVLCLPLLF